MNNSTYNRLFCLVVVLALMIWRCPAFLVEPRFWAEEGKYYFESAYNNGFWHGMFAQHFGYFSLVPNVATAFATLLPLENAPLFTTYTAAVFQLLVCSVVIFGKSPLWDTVPRKLLVACGMLLLAPGEVWLTTICTQYWLTIAAFLLLLEPAVTTGLLRKWLYRSSILICGLTSVTACFMTPLYYYKAIRNREREVLVQACILGGATLVQLSILFSSLGSESHLNARFGGNDFSLPKLAMLQLVWPFTGNTVFDSGAVIALDEWFVSKGLFLASMPRFSELVSALLISGLVTLLAWHYRKDRDRQLIVAAFLLTAVLSTVLSIRMASSPRYVFAPSVMLLVLFAAEFGLEQARAMKISVSVLLLVFMASGLREFRSGVYYNTYWPKWRDEVAIWRVQPGYRLQIWPQFRSTRWTMELTRHE